MLSVGGDGGISDTGFYRSNSVKTLKEVIHREQFMKLQSVPIQDYSTYTLLIKTVYTASCIPGSAPQHTSPYILSMNFLALISENIQGWHICTE